MAPMTIKQKWITFFSLIVLLLALGIIGIADGVLYGVPLGNAPQNTVQYFAELDANGVVKRVVVASQEYINTGKMGDPRFFVETFMDGSQRKNYAGKGYTFDSTRNAFIAPKPYPSWKLNEITATWEPPTAPPDNSKIYRWDEVNKIWKP